MIYFAPPYLQVDRLTILKDHADPLQFYFFPVAPRLALNPDGTPSFLFVKYRQDLSNLPQGSEPGGGFLNFDVDLHVDQSELDQAITQIKHQMNLEQTPRLAALDYRTGKTRLIFLDAQDPADAQPPSSGSGSDSGASTPPATPPTQPVFVEKASYAATPSLYGDNRAAFSVQLSAEGATLVEATLDANTSLVGVVFDMTFVGLRPAYSVQVTVDWNRVWDYMETEFKANCLFFSADIDNATEKLIENQAIHIDVISYGAGTADADIIADKDDAIKYLQSFITDKFFQPSMDPTQAGSDKWYSQVGALRQVLEPTSFGYTSKHLQRDDVKTLSLNMSERSGEERRIVPQGHLGGLLTVLKSLPLDSYVKEVDLNDPFFQAVKVDVIAGGAMATDKIDHIVVHLEYGPDEAKAPQDILLNSPTDKGHAQWALNASAGLNYQYSYTVFFKPDAPPGKGDNVQSPTITTNATKLVIDPRDLYRIQTVHVQQINVPFDRYPEIQVELRYADTDAGISLDKPFVIQKGSESADWAFRLSDAANTAYEYRSTFYPVGAEPIPGTWQTTVDPAVLITDPYPKTINVTVSPAGGPTIQTIFVDLSYHDPANGISQDDLFSFKPGDGMKAWVVHIADPTKRDYTYTVHVQYKDGTIKDLAPVTCADTLIFVGDVFNRTFRLTVSASGKSFSDAELSKVRVLLSYDDNANQIHASEEVILNSVDDKSDWSFEMKDASVNTYSYAVTYYGLDGFSRNIPAQQSSAEQLIIPIQ